jgi:protein phosphatase
MFYLANDVRQDLATRRCWACGYTDTPRAETVCRGCGQPLRDRRFLVSARWDHTRFEPYMVFFEKGLKHPGLAPPIDVFMVDGVLFSVVPYGGEGLMVDEASPFHNHRLLDLGQRLVGTLAYLHKHGVRLATLNRANLLISPDNSVRLFDIEVHTCYENGTSIPREQQQDVLRALGELLRRYCDIEADVLIDFMTNAEDGLVTDLSRFGREIESRFDVYAPKSYAPVLGGMSDVGLTRQLNEDNWGWVRLSERAKLYVVADGMGGHEGGEIASALAVKTLCQVARDREALSPQGEDAVENLLDESFQLANNTVKETADQKGMEGMGTTLVCMLVLDDHLAFIANVGDSRGYLLRNNVLHQITKDHSLVQKMVERGRITAEEARHHPHSNILLRTVGTERDIDIDIFRVELEPGDKLLMCSDGLWGEVEDRDMESILNTYSDPRLASRELVRAAHHGGGKDNVTLMIVCIPDT